MNPDIWGPPAWTFLHSITFAYPNNPTDVNKKNYAQFFNSLAPVLPCATCSYNYRQNLIDDPVENHLSNKKSLIKWLINVHNKVNIDNNKPTLNYQTVINNYTKLYNNEPILSTNLSTPTNTSTNTSSNYIIYILILLTIVFISIYAYVKYLK